MKFIPVVLFAVSLAAGEDVPGWVRDAAAQQAPAYPAKVATVTLLEDVNLTVGTDGRQTTRERGAVRILQRGRKAPAAYCYYNPKTGRVREFQAWLLPPSGKPAGFGKNAIVDFSMSDKYEFDEERGKVIEPSGDLAPGTVFAWESVDEEKTVFTADEHSFQDADPVLVSRYVLSLPAGWVATATLFNHDAVQPQITGSTYTWELHDLPWIEPEEHSPGFRSLAVRLGVNYRPEEANRPGLPPVRKWRDVSVQQASFYDPPAAVTEAIRSEALQLTSGAATELDKIRAIAAFVQKTNYVAVEINLARGGGYTPHAADQILARHYGDCKDKATLMRALLKASCIDAYPVVIHYGDRQYVRPEWPSPFQFNHAIVAVRVSPETKLPTVLEHPGLGRLLIFDPTDPVTPVGNLPESEQGSYALVIAGEDGDIVAMPLLPPDLNGVESTADARLQADGSLSAHLQRRYFGQQASRVRSMATLEEHDELKRAFEEALSYQLGGLSLNRIEPTDHLAEDQFQVNMDVAVKQFGQILQGRLLMVSPGALGRRSEYSFPAKPRTEPVRLEAESFRDSVTIAVPPQFKVDELPDAVQLAGAYGSYKAEWRADGARIVFEQSLEVNNTLAPAAQYASIRQFFEKVESAQNSSVVLVKE
jgi:hypothetical protein